MKKTFESLADEIFGEGTAKALTKGTGELKKHLLAEGVVLKKKDAETVIDAADAVAEVMDTPPADQSARDKLLMRMVDGMEALLNEVKDTMSATEVAEQKADTVEEEIKSLRKELTESIAAINKKMGMAPRLASQAAATAITDAAEIEKAKGSLAPAKTTRFGGLELSEE